MVKSENLTTVRTKHIECIIGKEEMEFVEDFDKQNLILISITNPGEDFIDKNISEGFKDKLELQFHDIRKYHKDAEHLIIEDNVAKNICDFILKNKNERFVIHCSAGISRSSAIGCAIEYFCEHKGDIKKYWEEESKVKKFWRYSPNIIVFNKICNTDFPIKYPEESLF